MEAGGSPGEQVPSSWLECSIYQNYTAPEVLVQVRRPATAPMVNIVKDSSNFWDSRD